MSDYHSSHRTCATCGLSEFYKSGRCAACQRAYAAAYRLANPDQTKTATAKWVENNPEKTKARMRRWRTENAAHVAEYDATYKAANYEKVRATEIAYRAANVEKVKAWAKNFRLNNKEKIATGDAEYYALHAKEIRAKVLLWQKENPEACRIKGQNRRAKLHAGGTLSKGLAKKLFALQRGKCPCCGEALGKNYHLDHIVPLSRGGLNVDSNIQLLRRSCNHQKHAKFPFEYMRSKGFLL